MANGAATKKKMDAAEKMLEDVRKAASAEERSRVFVEWMEKAGKKFNAENYVPGLRVSRNWNLERRIAFKEEMAGAFEKVCQQALDNVLELLKPAEQLAFLKAVYNAALEMLVEPAVAHFRQVAGIKTEGAGSAKAFKQALLDGKLDAPDNLKGKNLKAWKEAKEIYGPKMARVREGLEAIESVEAGLVKKIPKGRAALYIAGLAAVAGLLAYTEFSRDEYDKPPKPAPSKTVEDSGVAKEDLQHVLDQLLVLLDTAGHNLADKEKQGADKQRVEQLWAAGIGLREAVLTAKKDLREGMDSDVMWLQNQVLDFVHAVEELEVPKKAALAQKPTPVKPVVIAQETPVDVTALRSMLVQIGRKIDEATENLAGKKQAGADAAEVSKLERELGGYRALYNDFSVLKDRDLDKKRQAVAKLSTDVDGLLGRIGALEVRQASPEPSQAEVTIQRRTITIDLTKVAEQRARVSNALLPCVKTAGEGVLQTKLMRVLNNDKYYMKGKVEEVYTRIFVNPEKPQLGLKQTKGFNADGTETGSYVRAGQEGYVMSLVYGLVKDGVLPAEEFGLKPDVVQNLRK